MNTARFNLGGAGLPTASLALVVENQVIFQQLQNNIMELVGLKWHDLNTAREGFFGAGTTASGLAFGGRTGPVTFSA